MADDDHETLAAARAWLPHWDPDKVRSKMPTSPLVLREQTKKVLLDLAISIQRPDVLGIETTLDRLPANHALQFAEMMQLELEGAGPDVRKDPELVTNILFGIKKSAGRNAVFDLMAPAAPDPDRDAARRSAPPTDAARRVAARLTACFDGAWLGTLAAYYLPPDRCGPVDGWFGYSRDVEGDEWNSYERGGFARTPVFDASAWSRVVTSLEVIGRIGRVDRAGRKAANAALARARATLSSLKAKSARGDAHVLARGAHYGHLMLECILKTLSVRDPLEDTRGDENGTFDPCMTIHNGLIFCDLYDFLQCAPAPARGGRIVGVNVEGLSVDLAPLLPLLEATEGFAVFLPPRDVDLSADFAFKSVDLSADFAFMSVAECAMPVIQFGIDEDGDEEGTGFVASWTMEHLYTPAELAPKLGPEAGSVLRAVVGLHPDLIVPFSLDIRIRIAEIYEDRNHELEVNYVLTSKKHGNDAEIWITFVLDLFPGVGARAAAAFATMCECRMATWRVEATGGAAAPGKPTWPGSWERLVVAIKVKNGIGADRERRVRALWADNFAADESLLELARLFQEGHPKETVRSLIYLFRCASQAGLASGSRATREATAAFTAYSDPNAERKLGFSPEALVDLRSLYDRAVGLRDRGLLDESAPVDPDSRMPPLPDVFARRLAIEGAPVL